MTVKCPACGAVFDIRMENPGALTEKSNPRKEDRP